MTVRDLIEKKKAESPDFAKEYEREKAKLEQEIRMAELAGRFSDNKQG